MGWRGKTLDLLVLACFAGGTALVVWFGATAIGPKLGMLDGHFALETMTLRWGLGIAAAMLLLSTLAAILLVLERRSGGEWPPGVWVIAMSLALSLAIFPVTLVSATNYSAAPPVTEVTTDIEAPPGFSDALALRRGVDANLILTDGQHGPPHQLEPVFLDAPPDAVYGAVIAIAREQRWRIGSASQSRRMVELTVESFWYARTDDVVIRVTPDGEDGSRVDYRACARTGKRDGGRNARRLERLERLLEARFG